jgi:cytochrome c
MKFSCGVPQHLAGAVLASCLACWATTAAAGADAGPAAAMEAAPAVDAARAQALLHRAVALYKDIRDPAFAAFSRHADFVDGELYVYVVSISGEMLASGGPSSVLIGRNVADLRDANGKPFFHEMLDKAKAHGSGTVEYHWLNRVDNRVERKVAYFQRVGTRVIAVGYYVARATPERAQLMLTRAAEAVRADPQKAYDEFNRLHGGSFSEDDLYVFVVDLGDKKFRAHGVDHRLIGSDALLLHDSEGRPIVQEMIAQVQGKDYAELDYKWPNPVTGKIESKHTLLQKVGNELVGVGYYVR